MSLSINKNGVISTELYSEFIANTFDPNVYVEPDRSAQIRIVHHNNPASVRFVSSDTFTSQVYKDADRQFNVSLCNLLSGSWELMTIQTATSGGTQQKFRQIQSYNPMTATYANVASANITKITTSGYTSFSTGGIYPINSSAYLCTNNGTQGNQWGAFGAQNAHQGGIPAQNGVVVTTGFSDLYLRIDNSKANFDKSSFGNNYIQCREIQEY